MSGACTAAESTSDGSVVTVYAPGGQHRVRLTWSNSSANVNATPSLVELLPPAPASAAVTHAALLTEDVAHQATESSGCGGRTPGQLTDMVHAALTGRSAALSFNVAAAAEVVDATAPPSARLAMLMQLTYKTDFTDALIVIPLRPVDGSNGWEATDKPAQQARNAITSFESPAVTPAQVRSLMARVAELEAQLSASSERVRVVQLEKDKIAQYTSTKLLQMKRDLDAVTERFSRSGRDNGALKDSLAAARREAEHFRVLAEQHKREVSKLRDEMARRDRRSSATRSRPPSPVAASPTIVRSPRAALPATQRGRSLTPPPVRLQSPSPTQQRRSQRSSSLDSVGSTRRSTPPNAVARHNRFDTPPHGPSTAPRPTATTRSFDTSPERRQLHYQQVGRKGVTDYSGSSAASSAYTGTKTRNRFDDVDDRRHYTLPSRSAVNTWH